jgi:hypothetical protein
VDAAAGEDASLVYCSAVVIDASEDVVDLLPAPETADLASKLLASNVIPAGSSNVMARSDVLRELGGFDERLQQLADWDLWIRLSANGRAVRCDEVLVAYRHHAANMMLVDPKTVFHELDRLAAKHRALSLARGVEVDRLRFSRWIAWGHRRAGRRLAAAAAYFETAWRFRSAGDVARGLAVLLGERAFNVPTLLARGCRLTRPGWL